MPHGDSLLELARVVDAERRRLAVCRHPYRMRALRTWLAKALVGAGERVMPRPLDRPAQ